MIEKVFAVSIDDNMHAAAYLISFVWYAITWYYMIFILYAHDLWFWSAVLSSTVRCPRFFFVKQHFSSFLFSKRHCPFIGFLCLGSRIVTQQRMAFGPRAQEILRRLRKQRWITCPGSECNFLESKSCTSSGGGSWMVRHEKNSEFWDLREWFLPLL